MSPRFHLRSASFVVTLLVATALTPTQGSSQVVEGDRTYEQVVSANPFGILLEFFNAEYERVLTASTTVGIGGSYWNRDDNYRNADVFWRFYLEENPLEGWAFGTKLGLTNVPDEGTFFGIGFDLNRSWLMGPNDNFYIGAGFGLKRLLGTGDDEEMDLRYIPTIRVVNVGVAF